VKCSYVVVVPLDNVTAPTFVPGPECDAGLSQNVFPIALAVADALVDLPPGREG
jgi:hypothetical protein